MNYVTGEKYLKVRKVQAQGDRTVEELKCILNVKKVLQMLKKY